MCWLLVNWDFAFDMKEVNDSISFSIQCESYHIAPWKRPLLLEKSRLSTEGTAGLWFLVYSPVWIKWFLDSRENNFACDCTKCFTHCPPVENNSAFSAGLFAKGGGPFPFSILVRPRKSAQFKVPLNWWLNLQLFLVYLLSFVKAHGLVAIADI